MNNKYEGRIYEISNERQITGRRPIKIILHEIFQSPDSYQKNGISWNETYTMQNLDSVSGMSICVEFLDDERSIPYGHGLTDIQDNMPLMENATMIGHCDRAYIDDVSIDGTIKRVLIAEGTLDEMRYPKFIQWLREKMESSTAEGSVEIVGRKENDNRIIYDGGWKEKGRIPQIYDYSGYCILGVDPADDAAIVMELNNKQNKNEEDTAMDEKTMSQIIDSTKTAVSEAVSELNNRWDEYYARVQEKEAEIAQLRADIAQKDAELEQLRADYAAAEAKSALAEAGIAEANEKIGNLEKEKKISEMNAALADFTEEERALAKDEIAAFMNNPDEIEINSITGKICMEMVRKNKELNANTDNEAVPDIYGFVSAPEEVGEVDIF